jgi:hypothetical protein
MQCPYTRSARPQVARRVKLRLEAKLLGSWRQSACIGSAYIGSTRAGGAAGEAAPGGQAAGQRRRGPHPLHHARLPRAPVRAAIWRLSRWPPAQAPRWHSEGLPAPVLPPCGPRTCSPVSSQLCSVGAPQPCSRPRPAGRCLAAHSRMRAWWATRCPGMSSLRGRERGRLCASGAGSGSAIKAILASTRAS